MLFRGLTIPGQAASNDEPSRNHSEMPQSEVDPKESRNATEISEMHSLQCEAPKIAKLVYNSNNYGLWYLSHFITIVTGAYKPTYILGASHCTKRAAANSYTGGCPIVGSRGWEAMIETTYKQLDM